MILKTFLCRARLAATAVFALAMPVGEAVAVPLDVYIATDQSGAQTFINRTDISYWTFATNANSVANFTGGFFKMKNGGATADVKFVVIVGTYANFQSSYDASSGVYSGSSVISASAAASSIGSSFATLTIADLDTFGNPIPVTLAANTTFTAVLFSAATDIGNDTFFVKNNGDLFWTDASGTQIDPGGYTTGGDLVTTSGATAVPGTGVLALAGLGLAARRRRR